MVLARNLLRDIELFLPIGALFGLAMGQAGNGALLLWLLLFAVLPFFNRDRLRAGDLVAGSWVVERPKQKLEAAMSTGQVAATGTSPDHRGQLSLFRRGTESLWRIRIADAGTRAARKPL